MQTALHERSFAIRFICMAANGALSAFLRFAARAGSSSPAAPGFGEITRRERRALVGVERTLLAHPSRDIAQRFVAHVLDAQALRFRVPRSG